MENILDYLDPAAFAVSAFVVIFVVNQIKQWVAPKLLPLASAGTGIAVQVVNDYAIATEPLARGDWWMTIVTGIFVGAVASGAYDIAGRPRSEVQPLTGRDLDALQAITPQIFGATPGVVPNDGGDYEAAYPHDEDDTVTT